MLKTLVIGNCSQKKAAFTTKIVDSRLIEDKEFIDKVKRHEKLNVPVMPSWQLYKGRQHNKTVEGVRTLEKLGLCDFYILSAAFGLVNANDELPLYDYSFNGMSRSQILHHCELIGLNAQLKHLFKQNYDIIFFLLSKKYFDRIKFSLKYIPESTIRIVFGSKMNVTSMNLINLTANIETIKEFSRYDMRCGESSSLKGYYFVYICQIINKIIKKIQNHKKSSIIFGKTYDEIINTDLSPKGIYNSLSIKSIS